MAAVAPLRAVDPQIALLSGNRFFSAFTRCKVWLRVSVGACLTSRVFSVQRFHRIADGGFGHVKYDAKGLVQYVFLKGSAVRGSTWICMGLSPYAVAASCHNNTRKASDNRSREATTLLRCALPACAGLNVETFPIYSCCPL